MSELSLFAVALVLMWAILSVGLFMGYGLAYLGFGGDITKMTRRRTVLLILFCVLLPPLILLAGG